MLNKRNRRKTILYSLLAVNLLVAGVVTTLVLTQKPTAQKKTSAANVLTATTETANPLDELSSADIAVTIAEVNVLPETTAVSNLADSINSQLTVASESNIVISKPQVIATGLKSRKDIQEYVVQAGETVSSIAAKFEITTDTVKWANNLSGDALNAGSKLLISPISGILYKVQGGDTIDAILAKYPVNRQQFVNFNDLESGRLPVGEYVVLPDGRPAAARASSGSRSGFAVYSDISFVARYGASNGYDYGWCTWWAAKRRIDIGRPLPTNLGNAITWASRARSAGIAVDGSPRSGDVAYYRNIGGWGHVGFVERVNADGSIWISDMNYFGVNQIDGTVRAGGWGRTSYHLVGVGELGSYLFIH